MINKQNKQRFHTSVQNKEGKKNKNAFALVRLPQWGNKHSYNLLRSNIIERSPPGVGQAGPRAAGSAAAQQQQRRLCSPKSTSCMFNREEQKRYSFTGKIHNPKLLKSVTATRQLG